MTTATTMTSMASRQVNWSWSKRSCQFMGALPAPLRATGNSSPSLLDGRQNLQKVDGLADVVHAHHRRSGAMRRGHGRQRADGALRPGAPSGEMSDEGLARCADDHGPDAAQLVRAGQDLQVVLEGLGEADAGVDQDLLDARGARV